MKRLIPTMKAQGVMFAEHFLDDRLPQSHEVYAFDALLKSIDIGSIMETYRSEGGNVCLPGDMPAVLLYAYSRGITSSYRIAEEVRANIAFIFLAGGHIISRRVMGNIKQNLFFTFVYNFLGIRVAAGVLYPFLSVLLSPVIGVATMSLSSVSVIVNALRLRR